MAVPGAGGALAVADDGADAACEEQPTPHLGGVRIVAGGCPRRAAAPVTPNEKSFSPSCSSGESSTLTVPDGGRRRSQADALPDVGEVRLPAHPTTILSPWLPGCSPGRTREARSLDFGLTPKAGAPIVVRAAGARLGLRLLRGTALLPSRSTLLGTDTHITTITVSHISDELIAPGATRVRCNQRRPRVRQSRLSSALAQLVLHHLFQLLL